MPPLLLILACSDPAPTLVAAPPAVLPTQDDGKGCPPGMVRVRGEGTLGMDASVYAIVETKHLRVVEAPEAGCPAALAAHEDPAACWVQTDLVDPVVPPHRVSVDVCIDAWPFPGPGQAYSTDGLTPWDVLHLGELLDSGRYGTRRLCTFSEFEAAVAGLASNRRFVTGDHHAPERCGAETGPIGEPPLCMNEETRVHDYGAVLSHWVVADPAFVAAACPAPPCLGAGNKALVAGAFVVAGEVPPADPPGPLTPHTWHDHGEPNPQGCDEMGHDDQPVICASPDSRYRQPDPSVDAQEAAWGLLRDRLLQTGSMTALLETGLSRAVCPPPASP